MNGTIQGETFDAVVTLPSRSLRSIMLSILPHRENLIMAGGREIKGGIVLHPIIAAAIVGLLVTIGLGVRAELNWQHDQIVILATQKADAAEDRKKEEQRQALNDSEMRARLENVTVQLAIIKKVQEGQALKEQ